MTPFEAGMRQAVGDRVRVKLDAERFPYAPATHGRLEDRGLEPDGTRLVFAYVHSSVIANRIGALAGVTPCQVGDRERVYAMASDDLPTIRAVAGLLRTRTRPMPNRGSFRKPAEGGLSAQESTSSLEVDP